MYDRPRPHAAADVGDRVKLHRRTVRAAGREFTVISPRPGTDVRFSTNRFHETWHIVTDARGARFLGRLLWGLAYTRVPDTVIVIDRPFLEPNPFDAERSDPILLAPSGLTPLSDRTAKALRHALPHGTPAGSVRWHTPGLAPAAAERWPEWTPGAAFVRSRPPRGPERMARLGGFVAFTGSPGVLRSSGLFVHHLAENFRQGTCHIELDDYNGEVQLFRDYRARVSAARVARREILADVQPADPASVIPLIWTRGAQARQRGRFRRDRTPLP